MYALASDHVLNYRITQQSAGSVRLTMWEMAKTIDKRSKKPYLYRINLYFDCEDAARITLKQHLALNGAVGVANLEVPLEGRVRIMPYPTWSGE
ncbi:hypothetical protein C7271_03270 [filamentous cyanobacterium CCP5]|nr:hypothetical protein C7271_03270 [filamentous cyanobacterium CCP5]